jgi:hypothetical protein
VKSRLFQKKTSEAGYRTLIDQSKQSVGVLLGGAKGRRWNKARASALVSVGMFNRAPQTPEIR